MINLDTLTVDKIMSVYSGKHGCCCGCVGKHTTASAHRETNSKDRGYPVTDDEVSDRSVKIIFNKIMSFPRGQIEVDKTYISIDTETRRYIAYLVPSNAE